MKKLFFIISSLVCLVFSSNGQKNGYKFSVDNFPDVYGGKEEIKRFFHDQMVYPAKDFKAKKEGTVLVSFIVTKSGAATQFKIGEGVDETMNKEAMRLARLVDWQPSYKGGAAVDVDFYLEVPFSISKYKKAVKERGFDTPLYTDIPTDTSLSVHETAERLPLFNNPDKTFTEFIYSNLEYPEIALRQNIEGIIKLSFIIEPNGMVSNIKILNGGLAAGCNNEAIRVIGLTKWQPAIRDKQYIRYRMYFTMNFSLKNNFKDNANGSQRSWGQ